MTRPHTCLPTTLLFLTTALLPSIALPTIALPAQGLESESTLEAARQKSDLRILVTGIVGSERLERYAEFLRGEFKTVGTTSYSKFRPEQAAAFDVVIFDCEYRPTPGRIGLPPSPKLPKDYDRASVFVSGAGSLIGRALKTKIDWH